MALTPINPCSIIFFLMFICNSAVCTEETMINFQELDLAEASEGGKKIMVSFTADWCLPCKVIKSSLYNDPEIADLVNENFQAVLIDVDSFLGDSWDQDFNIDYLPSIIFTNSSGVEFERTKGTPSREEFLSTLRRIINTDKVPYRAHNYTDLEKSNLVQSGIAIQLGAFSTLTSAERRIHELSALEENNCIIIQEETKGRLFYKIVHEGLLSKDESISMLRHYHKNGFEAFIRPD